MIRNYQLGVFSNECFEMPTWSPHTYPFGILVRDTAATPAGLFMWGENSYNLDSGYNQSVWSSGIIGSGLGKYLYTQLKGAEGMKEKCIVILEGSPDYSIEKWKIDGAAPVYTGKGLSAHGDADNQFNNPQDVTVDTQDNIYVLDILSNGQPRVKVFNANCQPIGGIGDNTLIPGTPMRCDWDDQYDALHVLHSNGVAIIYK